MTTPTRFITQAPRACVMVFSIFLSLLSAQATAQPALAAASPSTPANPDSQAWVVINDHASRPGSSTAVLVHVPPRTGEQPAPLGSAELVRTLDEKPDAVSAWGTMVYLAFQGLGPDKNPVVRLRSMRTVRQGFGWVYTPPERFTPHPALKHEGSIRSIAAAEGLIAVVMSSPDAGDEVFVLTRNKWQKLTLPAHDQGATILAWNTPGGISIGTRAQGRLVAQKLELLDNELTLGASQTIGTVSDNADVWAIGTGLYALERTDSELRVSQIGSTEATTIAQISLRTQAAITPVFAAGPRIMALWWQRPTPETQRGALPILHTVEVSLASGQTLYDGPLPISELLSIDEFRMLAMMLTAVVIGVLIIVLKGDLDQDAVPIPQGTALAEPSRRFMATGIDFAVATALVATLYGVGFWQLITLQVLFESPGQWTAIPAVFITGALIGTISEALSGRTIGKFLTGIRVIPLGVEKLPAPPVGLRRALIRNTIKWIFPPVAALAAVDENGRHRGDQIAKLVVIVELEPQGPET
jgi:uncharacterized RDD family membrane protein YckC